MQNGNGIWIEKSYKIAATDMPWSHAHPNYELYFLLSGERRYFVGHRIYDVAPGELVVIPKNELHRTTAPGGVGYERYVFTLIRCVLIVWRIALGLTSAEGLYKADVSVCRPIALVKSNRFFRL